MSQNILKWLFEMIESGFIKQCLTYKAESIYFTNNEGEYKYDHLGLFLDKKKVLRIIN